MPESSRAFSWSMSYHSNAWFVDSHGTTVIHVATFMSNIQNLSYSWCPNCLADVMPSNNAAQGPSFHLYWMEEGCWSAQCEVRCPAGFSTSRAWVYSCQARDMASKRKNLTLQDKLKVIEMREKGYSLVKVGQEYRKVYSP